MSQTSTIAISLRDEILLELSVILARPAHSAAEVLGALQRLDRLKHERAAELPARLRHFLEGRSYTKAQEYLTNGRPESGACSPHPAAM